MHRWQDLVELPVPGRIGKPRRAGLTMIIDKGLGLTELNELVANAGSYIDMIKLGFGTSLLYQEAVLQQKIKTVREAGIGIFPGGTFFEIVYLQNKIGPYCELLTKYGFSAIEISDGTIDLPMSDRRAAIRTAKSFGLQVVTEIGKKDPRDKVSMVSLREQLEQDLAAGASKVIVEGRESGKGVMLYDNKGELKEAELEALLKDQFNPEDILWEAPLKSQQQKLISLFGCNVNLGNVQPNEILALEALRVGLRGDTLRSWLQRQKTIIPLTLVQEKEESYNVNQLLMK